jgi:2-polyprenyl-3-methyl-5-hydroxy-6-metoxy-1,4-benzoquinol methylase
VTRHHEASRAVFDRYSAEYTQLHAASIRASGEDPSYFADYKIACLERLGLLRGTVLDYGCGIGTLTERLARDGRDVYGYDVSKASLELAAPRAPTAKFVESIETLPTAYFELAVLSGVLHHVARSERERIVRDVAARLRPGGVIAIFEHNPLNPLTRRAVRMCEFDRDAILLWPWETTSLLGAAAFLEVRRDFIVFFPRALRALRPLEPRLRWMPLGAQTLTIGTKG